MPAGVRIGGHSFNSIETENPDMKKNNIKIKIHQSQKLNQLNVSSIKTNLALCYHADKEGLCYPTKGTLERLTGLSKRSIYRAIPSLIDAGLIREEFTNLSGVTVYRVTRRGSFIVLDAGDLSAIMDIGTKSDIIKELDRFGGGDKNPVTPPQKVVTPLSNPVTPPADSVTPYTSYTEKELTIQLELDTMKHLEQIELTTTQLNYFNALWDRYSVRPSSLWRSDNALQEFKSIFAPLQGLFSSKKNLVTELRAFDAYLLELEARRLGGFNVSYADTPFIYAGRGWLKGLKRWLEAPSPATLGEKRRKIISIYGIEVHETPITHSSPVKAPKTPSTDRQGVSAPPKASKEFTGRIEAKRWYDYMLDMTRKYQDYHERVVMVALESENWTAEEIQIIDTTPELEELALWVYCRNQNKQGHIFRDKVVRSLEDVYGYFGQGCV